MLKVRGGHRFEGYGNVKLGTDHGTRAGWQLICHECQGLSDVIHRTGSSFPPKILIKIFSDRGWKVGQSSASDVCPACLEKRREKARAERKQYAKGNVDRLLDMIRQVDLMLASNVALDYGPYQPQITAQLKSLCETAYLCGMLPTEPFRTDVGNIPTSPDVSNLDTPPPVENVGDIPAPPATAVVAVSASPMPLSEWQYGSHIDSMPQQQPSPEPPPPEPPPPPPAPEVERMSPRTAAFLAEVRKQIFKGAAA